MRDLEGRFPVRFSGLLEVCSGHLWAFSDRVIIAVDLSTSFFSEPFQASL